MYAWAYMNAFEFIYLPACMHIYVHVFVYAGICKSTCVCVCMRMNKCTCLHVCACVCVLLSMSAGLYGCVQINEHTRVWVGMYVYTYNPIFFYIFRRSLNVVICDHLVTF